MQNLVGYFHWWHPFRRSYGINQSHRYGRPQATCREQAGSYDKTTRTAICFEHKTQYLLIRAPYTRIVVFWHISNIPPMISQSQISCNTPRLYSSNFCEILLYNRQLVVITHKLIKGVRAAIRGGKWLWKRSIRWYGGWLCGTCYLWDVHFQSVQDW